MKKEKTIFGGSFKLKYFVDNKANIYVLFCALVKNPRLEKNWHFAEKKNHVDDDDSLVSRIIE